MFFDSPSTGPEASRLRSALNPKLLKLQEVVTFAPVINAVVGDLLRRVDFCRSGSQDGVTVSDVAAELYKFGFEGGSCFSVPGKSDQNPESFGNSSFLQESRRSCLKPGWVAWRRRSIQTSSASSQPSTTCWLCLTSLTSSLDGPAASSPGGNASSRAGTTSQTLVCSRSRQFGLWTPQISADPQFLCLPTAASSLINKRIAEIEARVASGQSVEGLYLTHLLSSNKLSRAEIYTCITELLLGGVDTVPSRKNQPGSLVLRGTCFIVGTRPVCVCC